jgi:chromosomal replication initiator protein
MELNPAEVWAAAQAQLQLQVHEKTYEAWLKGVTFLAYERGVFTLAAPNAFTKDWLEQRLHRVVQRALAQVMGGAVELHFALGPNGAPPPVATAPSAAMGPTLDDILAEIIEDAKKPKTRPSPRTTPPAAVEVTPAATNAVFAQTSRLNPHYHLEDFVPGSCNQMALAAVQAIVAGQAQHYNPLVIYGPTGLGKTHLVHGLGNALRAAGKQVLYVDGEAFTNDFLRSLRLHQMEAFREFYRVAEVFIMEDVSFIAGKESTQGEFFNTFNSLFHQNCRLIFTSQRHPSEVTEFDPRISSRLEAGLALELTLPALETRMAIAKTKAAAQGASLPDEVARLLANKHADSLRSLEGALNQVLAQATFNRKPLTVEYVHKLLKGRPAPVERSLEDQLTEVFEATARYHQLSLDDLFSKQRKAGVVRARHLAIFLAREELQTSLPDIGRVLGGRSHATIISSYRKMEDKVKDDPKFRGDYLRLRTFFRENYRS